MVFAKKVVAGAAKEPAKKRVVRKTTPKKITFDAPSDMKPCFIELSFKTQEDGLLGPSFKAFRIKGLWTNPEAIRFDMLEYDARTVASLMARLGARTFATNALRRLPPDTAFRLVIRVGKRAADGSILASVKSIAKLTETKSGKKQWKELADKTDPIRRKLRSVTRFLAGAFVAIQLPPSKRKKKETEEE
jgi:hypothetical protein